MDEAESKYINVAIRIRPSSDKHNSLELLTEKPPVLYVPEKNLTYSFDHVFTSKSSQEDIYNKLIKPLVGKVIEGNKCIVFAYGQTGTGKSYTMGTDSTQTYENAGIISRTIQDLLERKKEYYKVKLQVSFCEIYNNKVYDLLSEKKEPLIVAGFKRQELTTEAIDDEISAQKLLLKLGNRRVAETKQNKFSSRSHCILSVSCFITKGNETFQGKFNLVDLAGSESVGKTAKRVSLFQEGVSINHSLHCIGKVINALQVPNSFVPYRESLITTVLRDSLSIRNYITLIACVSAEAKNLMETVQTLQFSKTAKKIKIKPEINVLVETYKKTILATPKVMMSAEKQKNYLKVLSNKKKYFTPRINRLANKENKQIEEKTTETNTYRKLEYVDEVNENNKENDFALLNKMPMLPISSTPYVTRRSVRLSKIAEIKTDNFNPLTNKPLLSNNTSSFFGNDTTILQTPNTSHQTTLTDAFSGITTFDDQKFKVPATVKRPRRYTVLTIKKDDSMQVQKSAPVLKMPVRRSTRLSSVVKVKSSPVKRMNESLAVRRSCRLSIANVKPEPKEVSLKKIVEAKTIKRGRKAIKKEGARFSDTFDKFNHENMEKYILNILNKGDEKALMKLVTVGQKTAMQIYFYRKLNGNFKSIDDLKRLPWKAAAYKRFLKENLLLREEESPK